MRVLVATLGLLLSACGGTDQPTATTSALPTLEPLGLPVVATTPSARSTVPVLFAIDRASADALLEQYVPKRHVEKGRSVGHGVKLDVELTRKAPQYAVKNNELLVQQPLELSLEVHRKLGPLNVKLGRCSPELLATIRLSPVLTDQLEAKTPELGIALKEPCRLSGFDVTSVVEEETQKQRGRIVKQLDRELRRLPELLRDQAAAFARVPERSDGKCPHLRVERLVQGPLVEQDNVISTSLGVEGTLVEDCSPEPPPSWSVEQRPAPLTFETVTARLVNWEALSRVLEPILASHGLLDAPVKLAPVTVGNRELIAVGITSRRATGWVLVRAFEQDRTLRLEAVESANRDLLALVAPLFSPVTVALESTSHKRVTSALFARTRELSLVRLQDPKLERQLRPTRDDLKTQIVTRLAPTGVVVEERTQGS